MDPLLAKICAQLPSETLSFGLLVRGEVLKEQLRPSRQMPAGRKPHCYLVKVRPGLLNLQTKDTFQTLATRDSFGPMVARLMSTHLLAG